MCRRRALYIPRDLQPKESDAVMFIQKTQERETEDAYAVLGDSQTLLLRTWFGLCSYPVGVVILSWKLLSALALLW